MSPANSAMAMPPMRTRVVCAFLIFGVRKAGTPLLTASTPVRAEHPLEKARSRSRMKATCDRLSASTVKSALEATGASPIAHRNRPVTIMRATDPMKTYVGIANACDASRTPRRLTMTSRMTKPTASSTRHGSSTGSAEMMLSTPEETDTATVST